MPLQQGSSGPDVVGLQRQLGLKADGNFGPNTHDAVVAFQQEHGLDADGVVGPRTEAALRRAHQPPPPKPKPAPKQPEKPPPPEEEAGTATIKAARYTPGPGDVNAEELGKVMPKLKLRLAQDYLGPLNKGMTEFEIRGRLRMAAFLAQLAHESVELRYFEEIASGHAYDITVNPKLAKRLGNVNPGDGPRYKGRGPIQLTGRANYRKAGEYLHVPLEDFPDSAASPIVGFRIAGWFWSTRGLNALADAQEFVLITKRINGGTNGLASRQKYYATALEAIKA